MPFIVKLAGQKTRVDDGDPVQTVITQKLVLELLQDHISNPRDRFCGRFLRARRDRVVSLELVGLSGAAHFTWEGTLEISFEHGRRYRGRQARDRPATDRPPPESGRSTS